MMNMISFCDGKHDLLEIAELINEPFWDILPIFVKLKTYNLLTVNKNVL